MNDPPYAEVTYSNTQSDHIGEGNISANPIFVDPNNDDFHLQPDSPCINAGTNEGAPDTDIDGDPRPMLFTVDMGIDEYGWVEDFESEPTDFVDNPFFTVSDGRLHFNGDQVSDPEGTTWNGGDAPGSGWPLYGDSNYFENFVVSADTFWEDHSEGDGYGIFTSLVGDEDDESVPRSNVTFSISKSGEYLITKKKDDVSSTVVGWTKSSLLSTDGQNNRLSVKKVGPYYYFYIDEVEVERRIIEGFHGGGVGLYSMRTVDTSFDNFTVGPTSYSSFEDDYKNVFEDFNSVVGGFEEYPPVWTQLNNRLAFRGDRTDYIFFNDWNGGFSPGGLFPAASHSNFFKNFMVEVETYWEGGLDSMPYGLVICSQDSIASLESVEFYISSDGWYWIVQSVNGEWQELKQWTQSSLINTDGSANKISIQKQGMQFNFSINDTVVETLNVSGYGDIGGGIWFSASAHVDVSYDNFNITQPGTPPVAEAGVNQLVDPGITVTLNGSNSTDDTSISSYKWYQLQGPQVTLSDPTAVSPSFTAPEVTASTSTLAFQLRVTDGDRLHDSDITLVEVICATEGDVNGDCFVDLKDAIIPLQVITGGDSADVRSNYYNSGVDVNGDNQVGTEEAINALREEAGF